MIAHSRVNTMGYRVISFLLLILISACHPPVSSRYPTFEDAVVSPIHYDLVLDEMIIAQPAIYENTLLLRTQTHLKSYDLKTGEYLWEMSLQDSRSKNSYIFDNYPLLIDEGRLYLEDWPGVIAQVDIQDHTTLWERGPSPVTEIGKGLYSITSIQTSPDHVFVARFQWGISAYDKQSGELHWEIDFSDGERKNMSYDPAQDRLYFSSGDRVGAVDGSSGEILWEQRLAYQGGNILWKDNLFYVLQGGPLDPFEGNVGIVLAIDTRTQSVVWQTETVGAPIVICESGSNKDMILISSDGMSTLSSAGKIEPLSQFELKFDIVSCPLVFNDQDIYQGHLNPFSTRERFIIVNNEGALRVFSLPDLQYGYTYNFPVNPVSNGKHLVVVIDSYSVRVFKTNE